MGPKIDNFLNNLGYFFHSLCFILFPGQTDYCGFQCRLVAWCTLVACCVQVTPSFKVSWSTERIPASCGIMFLFCFQVWMVLCIPSLRSVPMDSYVFDLLAQPLEERFAVRFSSRYTRSWSQCLFSDWITTLSRGASKSHWVSRESKRKNGCRGNRCRPDVKHSSSGGWQLCCVGFRTA